MSPMRLAAFVDSIYRREGDVLTVHRAFATFMCGLRDELDGLTVLGRLDPEPGRTHYELRQDVEFVALPHYPSLADLPAAGRGAAGALTRFRDVLRRVDAIWVIGPHPIGLIVVLMALAMRRMPILGVRQDTLAYARSRYPGRWPARAALMLLEAAWRLLALRLPVVVVGPELARAYRFSRRLHELTVSLVSEEDIVTEAPARDYSGPRRVLSVGRLESEKNPLLLADALRRLVDAGGEWRLSIAGDGPLEQDLRDRLKGLALDGQAELLGYVPIDRGLLDLYRDSHVFLHVSWTEGLPQVLLEAFAARLPVVATDVGGVRAVAEGAALLIAPGDPQAAAAAVRRLCEDAALRARLVEAGAQRVRERTREAELRRLAAFMRSVTRV